MNHHSEPLTYLPPEQQGIRDKCFHPSGTFVEFPKEEIEQSIPARFEKILSKSANSGIFVDDLRLSISPRALAFLIYTSGATGQPKGVIQDHRNRLHQFMWSTNTNHICEHDRSSLLTSGTSSAVVVSLRTLLNGAMLLPFDIRREGVDNLAGWLLREKISVCVVSSPLFRSLCESLTGKEGFPDLRLIRLSSETAYKN